MSKYRKFVSSLSRQYKDLKPAQQSLRQPQAHLTGKAFSCSDVSDFRSMVMCRGTSLDHAISVCEELLRAALGLEAGIALQTLTDRKCHTLDLCHYQSPNG